VVLGTIGFQQVAGPEESIWDSIYRAIQLFGFGGGVAPPVPLTLQIARFLGPALVGYAAIRGIIALFREQAQLLAFRRLHNHIVVTGLGEIGFRLASMLQEAGAHVVAIERDPANPAITSCHERGIGVLAGDATDPDLLDKVRVAKSRYLMVTCGRDPINIDVAAAARGLAVRRVGGVLNAFVQLDDRALWQSMRAEALQTRAGKRFRLEFFNVAETAARVMLERYPPFAATRAAQGPPRILVVADEWMAESLTLHLVRLWQNAERSSSGPLSLVLGGPLADHHRSTLLRRYSRLPALCDLEAVPEEFDSPDLAAEVARDVTAVYVALADEARGLATALALRAHLADPVEIVLAANDAHGGVANAFPEREQGEAPIHLFGTLSEVLAPRLLFRGVNEALARARHEDYVRRETELGVTPGEGSLVPWKDLPPALKESNRRFAGGIWKKLRAGGCVVVPAPLGGRNEHGFAFSAEEVDALAPGEHERWMDDLIYDGWRLTSGPKDPGRKLHPKLKDWEELEEADRERDRDAIRAIPRLLNRVGYEVYRVRTPRS
jgi:hypothetical protein